MPVWLTIIVSVVGLVGTVLGIFGITTYISEIAKQKAKSKIDSKKEEEETLREATREKYINSLREIIKEEIKPLKEDISQIKDDISYNTLGEVTLLRDRMKEKRDIYCTREWASASDKANWSELYNSYRQLGGNHFKEYVDSWKNEIEQLPNKKEVRKKKQLLKEKL